MLDEASKMFLISSGVDFFGHVFWGFFIIIFQVKKCFHSTSGKLSVLYIFIMGITRRTEKHPLFHWQWIRETVITALSRIAQHQEGDHEMLSEKKIL